MLTSLVTDEMSARRGTKRAVARGPTFVGPSKFRKGPTFVGPKMKNKQECPECGEASEHMKRHLYQSHISEQWWKLLPLLACWKWERFEIHQHVAGHGPFNSEIHGQQFFSEAQRIFDYLQQKLLVPKERMLQVVRDKHLVCKSITFSLPELDVLDLLDHNMGLS